MIGQIVVTLLGILGFIILIVAIVIDDTVSPEAKARQYEAERQIDLHRFQSRVRRDAEMTRRDIDDEMRRRRG